MRLSEAIRLGSMLGPQLIGADHDSHGGSCARGAAAKAAGCSSFFETPWFADRGGIAWQIVKCPTCQQKGHLAGIMAYHLNDRDGWTREAIADWVETIEQQQEAAQPVEQLTLR